jgi:hypothetical protein
MIFVLIGYRLIFPVYTIAVNRNCTQEQLVERYLIWNLKDFKVYSERL